MAEPTSPKAHRVTTLSSIDLGSKLKKARYEKALKPLQHQLRAIQLAYRRSGARAIIALEGWDAAGKGGLIRRMAGELDPRGFHVWPIAAPSAEEQGRHYLYRFWTRLPAPGEIAVFDRSWYGRVLVERVAGLAPAPVWRRAYREINEFEQQLSADGARIIKIFLHISEAEQLRRFRERIEEPVKRWKMTPDDLRNAIQRKAYLKATEEMLKRTSTAWAPWWVVPGEDKRYARIAGLDLLARRLGEDLDLAPAPLDPEVNRLAQELLGLYGPCRPAAVEAAGGLVKAAGKVSGRRRRRRDKR